MKPANGLTVMRETAAGYAEAADVYRPVGVPVIEGLTAFHRGAYDQALAALLPVRVELADRR